MRSPNSPLSDGWDGQVHLFIFSFPAVLTPIGEHFTLIGFRKLRQNPDDDVVGRIFGNPRARQIDVKAGDVGKFPGDHSGRTQHRRHAGIKNFFAGDFVNSVGNNSNTDWNGNAQLTDGLSDATTPVFDKDGNFLRDWGVAGSGDGAFNSPSGIAIDSQDALYIVDGRNHRAADLVADRRTCPQTNAREGN